MNCLVCPNIAVYGDLCPDCWLGLKCFKRNTKLLGRAISYLSANKPKLRTKHQRRELRRKQTLLQRLIADQQEDAKDREIRFENATRK